MPRPLTAPTGSLAAQIKLYDQYLQMYALSADQRARRRQGSGDTAPPPQQVADIPASHYALVLL